MSATPHVVVVGAGIGGLVAAADCARRGARVTVLDQAAGPGGKMREVMVGGQAIDAGPTVFTMRWIFDGLFTDAGRALADYVALEPAERLARHVWRSGGQLDLYADIDRSADAIGAFAGASEARAYRDFCARAADVYRTLAPTYIGAEKPNLVSLTSRVGLNNLDALWRTAPFKTLWTALGEHFADPRLRQLFGRYATYCGSSPFQAPATLMLVAHVEQEGVWLVTGGMANVARGLARLGGDLGAVYRYGEPVSEIAIARGQVAGVVLAGGERIAADAVIFNGDVAALGRGLLGDAARRGGQDTLTGARSLSAITWCAHAVTSGLALDRHTVFFADHYENEFHAIFKAGKITSAPTVYVCAQDRGNGQSPLPGTKERLLLLINAPADGDTWQPTPREMADLGGRAFGLLHACGLDITAGADGMVATTPKDFHTLFPGTGGALYGPANHGPMAGFERAGARTKIPGLYLAGGSVHPGPGIPMAAMSGRIAAARLLEDWAAARAGRKPQAVSIPITG